MSSIRPISICLLRKGDRILVNREYDSVKHDYYWRPLGGGIEFGEHNRDAVIREIREETDKEIENVHLLWVIENTFQMDGNEHHEIVFVYDAKFVDGSLYEQIELQCHERAVQQNFCSMLEDASGNSRVGRSPRSGWLGVATCYRIDYFNCLCRKQSMVWSFTIPMACIKA